VVECGALEKRCASDWRTGSSNLPPSAGDRRAGLSLVATRAALSRLCLDGDWRAPLATPSVVFIEDGGGLGLAAGQ
jgi:hypothetical protein